MDVNKIIERLLKLPKECEWAEFTAMVSRIIKEALAANLIKAEDPENTSRKFVKYIPIWA